MKNVHTEHCCVKHGCKYGEDDYCPVVQKQQKQSYTCESCSFEGIVTLKELFAENQQNELNPVETVFFDTNMKG